MVWCQERAKSSIELYILLTEVLRVFHHFGNLTRIINNGPQKKLQMIAEVPVRAAISWLCDFDDLCVLFESVKLLTCYSVGI